MNTPYKLATITWLSLLGLTLGSYFTAESTDLSLARNVAVTIILLAALFKFALIFLHFMEMQQANRGWKLMMLSLLSILCFGIYVAA